MEYFSAFLGRSCFWVRRACGCASSTLHLYLNLYFQVFLVVKHVCDCVQQPAPRLWLVSQALSSLRLGSGRQAGAPLTQDPPTKRCCKAIFIFWQQQISIKVVLGNIQGLVAHHLWCKHPIKSNLYSFYGMQLFIACHNHVIFGPKIWETLKAYIFNISIFLAFEMLWCIF